MSTISSTTPRSANMISTIALAVALITLLAFVVAQSAAAPKPAVVPVTGIQNAYIQYLRGEKAIYANPVAVNNAITAYHLGEKPLADVSDVLSMYLVGEKALYSVSDLDAALSAYRQGEKTLYTNPADLGDALSAWSFGEKVIVRLDALESALLTWRQGEKELK